MGRKPTRMKVTLPHDAMTAKLNASSWAVLVFLSQRGNPPGVRSRDIARELDLTDLSVRRALADIEERGWIKWTRHKGVREPLDIKLLWFPASKKKTEAATQSSIPM